MKEVKPQRGIIKTFLKKILIRRENRVVEVVITLLARTALHAAVYALFASAVVVHVDLSSHP